MILGGMSIAYQSAAAMEVYSQSNFIFGIQSSAHLRSQNFTIHSVFNRLTWPQLSISTVLHICARKLIQFNIFLFISLSWPQLPQIILHIHGRKILGQNIFLVYSFKWSRLFQVTDRYSKIGLYHDLYRNDGIGGTKYTTLLSPQHTQLKCIYSDGILWLLSLLCLLLSNLILIRVKLYN